MKLKTIHLDNKIKQAEKDLEELYKSIPKIKQYIRILKILKTKIIKTGTIMLWKNELYISDITETTQIMIKLSKEDIKYLKQKLNEN